MQGEIVNKVRNKLFTRLFAFCLCVVGVSGYVCMCIDTCIFLDIKRRVWYT